MKVVIVVALVAVIGACSGRDSGAEIERDRACQMISEAVAFQAGELDNVLGFVGATPGAEEKLEMIRSTARSAGYIDAEDGQRLAWTECEAAP